MGAEQFNRTYLDQLEQALTDEERNDFRMGSELLYEGTAKLMVLLPDWEMDSSLMMVVLTAQKVAEDCYRLSRPPTGSVN